MTRNRRAAVALSVIACVIAPQEARADGPGACAAAYVAAQTLRLKSSLRQSRDQLLVCSRESCGAALRVDCARWLNEVESALPSVVLAVRGTDGKDLSSVNVTMDGVALTDHVGGSAIPLDPGTHDFRFETPGAAPIDRRVILREGEKARPIEVVFEPPHAQPSPTSPGAHARSSWRTVGWVAGGTGAIGLAIGAAFGVMTLSDKSSAHCDPACDAGPLNDARAAATVSTIGFVAGGVLLAGGAALVLFAPSRGAQPGAAGLEIVPVFSSRDGGVVLRQRW